MKAIGLDIGTTSICAAVLDAKSGKLLDAVTAPNDTFFVSPHPWEKAQDPNRIWEKCSALLDSLTQKHGSVGGIGVTGQMHGIVYLDAQGRPVSPLYTWQDTRGGLLYQKNASYCGVLSELTGYTVAPGYGAATHFYNQLNRLVPPDACAVCTIHDYAAMKIAGLKRPVMHTSDAASFGLFDLNRQCFDKAALCKAGLDCGLFPCVMGAFGVIGQTAAGVPVAVAIGDNQASFLGSVCDMSNSILVNVGTGSQISLCTESPAKQAGMETRPFFESSYLLVGASLCGGRAYAVLESFFRSCAEMAGLHPGRLYPAMDALSEAFDSLDDKLAVSTLFCGTRENPQHRGKIENLGIANFTPRHLIVGVMEGMVDELFHMYSSLNPADFRKPAFLIGSGNGLRKSPVLQKMFARSFEMQVRIPVHKEEAAYGAALSALVACGRYPNIEAAQQIIHYQDGEEK